MSQSEMWRWADEQGEQRLVEEAELRLALANGVLPPSTLVWREGMSAWLPAEAVPEFASPPSGGESQAVDKPPMVPAPVGPAKHTLQGLHAQELYAAVHKTDDKPPVQPEKRTPSVAPPRPNVSPPKTPLAKTLRPNTGPAIPTAPRLPSEAPVKPALAPKPVPGPKIGPTAGAPAKTPAPAPVVKAPSTSSVDKDWGITDDETTNVPAKMMDIAARPEPPTEPAPADAPAPRPPQPTLSAIVRAAPPPGPQADRRPMDENTESTTYQFEKNALSLRAMKPSASARKESAEEQVEGQHQPDPTERLDVPQSLIDAYGKRTGQTLPRVSPSRSGDEAPPTTPSANLDVGSDDMVPAYASSTTRMEPLSQSKLSELSSARMDVLPAPPKMREPTATAMLPDDFKYDEGATDEEKALHKVSQTVRLTSDFLSQVNPGKSSNQPSQAVMTTRLDTSDPEIRNALEQLSAVPLPGSNQPQDPQQLVQLPQGQPHAATSLALRAVQPPVFEATRPPSQLPLNAILMSGAMLVVMVVGAFFVGRCSVKPTPNGSIEARSGFGVGAKFIQDNLPHPPKPCWVVRQPARYAANVSRNSSFGLLVDPSGKLVIGYAKSDDEAAGIKVTPTTSQVEEVYADTAKSEIARVSPLLKGFFISTVESSGSLKSLAPVPLEKPFYLGFADKHVAWSDQPAGAANRIWPINDDEPSPIQVLSLGNTGIVAAFRAGLSRQKKAYVGLLGVDHKPISNLVHVVGSGGLAGEPMVGSNGRELAVVFGDQAGEQSAVKMRIGHAPLGKIPASAAALDTPAGGPGGDANYPSIAGLADGRWVLVWTEGSSYGKSVRAQTFAPNFAPIGDPMMLSAPGFSYGPSMVGVIGGNVSVVFVQKGKSNNELWGSVLQCG